MTVKINKPAVNLREELNELKKPTGVAGEAMLRAENAQEQQALIGISGRRNFIMNGRGFIDQRGKSGASLGAGEFGLDRWSSSTAGTTMTQLSGGGFRGARTSANAWSRLSHRVEDCYNAIGTNELTISFDIKWNTHSGNDNSMVYLRWLQDNGTETGTAAAFDISKTGLSGKEKFTKTFTMRSDATNPKHLMILFYGAEGTGSAWDFELDNIQLELGKVATPFEHRSFGEELVLCKRYYEKSFNYDDAPANGSNTTSFSTNAGRNFCEIAIWAKQASRDFEVEKRVSPTITKYGNSQGYWGYLSGGTSAPANDNTFTFHQDLVVQTDSKKSVCANNQVSGNPLWGIIGHWTADAEL